MIILPSLTFIGRKLHIKTSQEQQELLTELHVLFNGVKVCLLTDTNVANKRLMTAVPGWATRGRCFVVFETALMLGFCFSVRKAQSLIIQGRKVVVVNKARSFLAPTLVGIPGSHSCLNVKSEAELG